MIENLPDLNGEPSHLRQHRLERVRRDKGADHGIAILLRTHHVHGLHGRMRGKLGEHAVDLFALPTLEAVPLIKRFAHSDRREASLSSPVTGNTPTSDECSVAAEQVQEKHRLQDVAHDESAVLTVPGERELQARAEGVERPHPENLDDLHVFVIGRDLAKEIGQIHGVLDHAHMELETLVGGDKFERRVGAFLREAGLLWVSSSEELLGTARSQPGVLSNEEDVEERSGWIARMNRVLERGSGSSHPRSSRDP